MTRECRECGDVRARINSGKSNSRGAVYVDESGRQWVGNTCPECRYKPTTIHTKTERKCRRCEAFLPPTRYFNCFHCVNDFNAPVDTWEGYSQILPPPNLRPMDLTVDVLPEEAV